MPAASSPPLLASAGSVVGVLLYAGILVGVLWLASRWARDAAGEGSDASGPPLPPSRR